VLMAAGFVAWERRAPAPMLPLGVFRSRGFSAGNASNFFQFASLFGAVFFMAQFLQVGLGYGPLGTGLRLLAWTATLTLVAPFAGALADKLGERPFMVAGLALQGLGMAWIALIADPGMGYGELIAPLIVTGSGTSMAMPALQSAVLGAVAPSQVGQASGTFTTVRQLGAAFGLALLVAVFAGAGSYASPAAFADGFVPAIAVSAGLAFGGVLTALLVPGRAPALATAPEPTPASP
jgi:MFS family permease